MRTVVAAGGGERVVGCTDMAEVGRHGLEGGEDGGGDEFGQEERNVIGTGSIWTSPRKIVKELGNDSGCCYSV